MDLPLSTALVGAFSMITKLRVDLRLTLYLLQLSWRVVGHLSEPRLPGVSEVLHLGDETVMLHVEAELAQLVAPQTELLRHGARRHGLEPRRYLRHVVSLPVLRVHDHTLALG